MFIVCDAGGGTVVGLEGSFETKLVVTLAQDLIAYRIKALEPLELVEVTEGTGWFASERK